MLNNAFEWERLVYPNPTDEMVTRRKAIVAGVLEPIDLEEDVGAVFQLVSAAMTGLSPDIGDDVEYGKVLTDITKKHHEAFPSLLSENALDLQLTACLALGEILTREPSTETWTEPQIAAAGLCLSTAVILSSSKELHLKNVQETLIAESRALLARTAFEVRKRPQFNPVNLEKLSPSADPASFWNALKPALMSAFESITHASAIDREELEVLWWLYNNKSLTFEKILSEMAPFDVAFAASIELVDRAICPAPPSLNSIIQAHVARAANNKRIAGKSLSSVIGSWTIQIIDSLLPADADNKSLVAAWPKVLPLSWIAGKIGNAGITTGWEQEFASRTGLNAGLKVTPDVLANQVFAERTAQRLLSQFAGVAS